MAKKKTAEAAKSTYTHDVSCNYEVIAGIASDFKGVLAGTNAGNLVNMAGSNIKASGKWEGKEQFVTAVRKHGNHIMEVMEKLSKLADRMEKAAQIMRDADVTVNGNIQ